MENKKDSNIIQKSIIFIERNLDRISLSFEQQCIGIPDFARWNLANDIASDWENYEQVVALLYEKGIINQNICSMINRLVGNFDEVSTGGAKYEEVIWTLEGLKNHIFWTEQRKLAKELLILLNRG